MAHPTLQFLAPPKGDLPPRCCARCHNSLFCFNDSRGCIMLRCLHQPAVSLLGPWHEKDDEAPDCIYFRK